MLSASNDTPYRIAYLGYDPIAFLSLCRSQSLKIVFMGKVDWLLSLTLNPFNNLYVFAYRLCVKGYFKTASVVLYSADFFYSLAGARYRRNSFFIKEIARNKILVIEGEVKDMKKAIDLYKPVLSVVNYWDILPEEVFDLFPKGLINIHPSLLPKYRGALPTLWALKNKDIETGVAYILLQKEMDKGPILQVIPFKLSPEDTVLTLEAKIAEINIKNFPTLVTNYLDGKITPIPQNDMEATYTEKYGKYREVLFFEESGLEIFNKVLMYPYFDPTQTCYFTFNGDRYPIKKCRYYKKYAPSGVRFGLTGVKIHQRDATLKMYYFVDVSLRGAVALWKRYKYQKI